MVDIRLAEAPETNNIQPRRKGVGHTLVFALTYTGPDCKSQLVRSGS